MGETVNIGRMAEIVSAEIFEHFRWRRSKLTNINWECVYENHGRSSHPADVVFSYKEPYENKTTYILCDLKSYAVGSITKAKLKKAIEELNKSVSCARVSPDWREKFVDVESNYCINGMLFIYNHDLGYDKDFAELFANTTKNIKIDKGNTISVFGPKKIEYLVTLVHNLNTMRGKGQLPPIDKCGYYYPELPNKSIFHSTAQLPLTLEQISSSYQIMRYAESDALVTSGLDIYHDGAGGDKDNFFYFLDYLRRNNCLQDPKRIRLFMPYRSSSAVINFNKALNLYCDRLEGQLAETMRRSISFEQIANSVKQQYFETEIGMRDE